MPPRCPSDDRLLAFIQGQQAPNAGKELQSHLADCNVCKQRIDQLRLNDDEFTDALEKQAKDHQPAANLKVDQVATEKFITGVHDSGALSFEKINALCEGYADTWSYAPSDTSISIDDLQGRLQQVGQTARPTLLRNLLHIDLAQRRNHGQQPAVDDYIEHLPQYASLIRQVFLHSSVMSPAGTACESMSQQRLPTQYLGDYQLLRQIGRGGMGFVFEAVHLKRRNRVALKTLPVTDGPALYRFKREFRSIADLNHPNLVGLHELESDGSQWFITMDLVDGTDFISYVCPSGKLNENRLRSCMMQLVKAVMALHAHHVIHRDIKPSNVMVTRDGRVVVLDFGLALESDQSMASTMHIAGTPAYMSPEQATADKIGGSSDWYAVGVMLYEALSGRLPFSGTPLNMLQLKQRGTPAALLSDDLPKDLCKLTIRLLAPNAEDRPNALDIASVFSSNETSDSHAVDNKTQVLVGRSHQLQDLNQAFEQFRDRHEPIAVFVNGRSGEGKTALGTTFLEQIQSESDAIVMSGRCYDRESMPFKALDSLIDVLGSYLRSIPEVESALLLPDDIAVLVQVFPALTRVEIIAKASNVRLSDISDEQVRARAFLALRELLRRISAKAPIVWFIDDVQWGDADSAEVLVDILRGPDAPLILLLVTYRTDEAETSAFLNSWSRQQRRQGIEIGRRDISVGPLSEQECLQLMINECGRDNEVVRSRAAEFTRETGGNPFLLVELIGCFDPATDSFEPLQMHEVLQRKMERLPDGAERLLEIIAVSGQAIPLQEASRAAGLDAVPMSILTHMRSERLTRVIGTESEARIDTYHDRIRETALSQIPDARRQELHLDLANAIQSGLNYAPDDFASFLDAPIADAQDSPPPLDRIYDLAYHYDAAGENTLAWTCSLLAAEQARQQRATEVAVEQYRIAKRNAATATPATQFRIAEGFGESLMLAAQFQEAKDQFINADQLASNPYYKARIAWLMCELAIKRNDLTEATEILSQTLRDLGRRVPRTNTGFAIAAAKESLIQVWHTYAPTATYQSNQTPDANSALINDLLNAGAKAYWFQSSVKLFWAHLASFNASERFAPTLERATPYSVHAIVMTVAGLATRGQRYADRASEIFEQFDDRLGIGCTKFFRGLGLFALGKYREAIVALTEAVRILEETGDPMYLNIGRYHIGLSHWMLGELDSGIVRLRNTFHNGVHLDDNALLHFTIDGWAKASRGKLPFQDAKSCIQAIPSDIQSTNQLIQAEGQWHLHNGRYEEAIEAYDRGFALVKKHVCFNWLTMPTLPSLVTALRHHADSLEQSNPTQADRLRKRAFRIIRRARWAFRFFPTDNAYVLREYALMLALKGSKRKALRVIEKSCREASEREEAYQLAESRIVLGKLRYELQIEGADSEIEAGKKKLAELLALIDSAESECLLP